MLKDVEPQSTCELEVDAVAADILNQLDIEGEVLITLHVKCLGTRNCIVIFIFRLNLVKPQSRFH